MKKKTALLSILLIMLSSIVVFAEFANPAVVDNAGYLTAEQSAELESTLDAIRNKYNFDVAIYTEQNMSGSDAMNSADDIFDYKGYGYGESKDGIILYVSANPRNYWISTHGSGLSYFNDNGLAYMQKSIVEKLKADDYYSAFKAYADKCDELLNMAAQGKPYNKKQMSTTSVIIIIAIAVVAPLLIARIMTNKKLKKMKTAVKQDYASNYMKPGSMTLSGSRDIFMYSNVVRTAKPKQTSSSHTSSSGETHGGAGGSF